MKVSLKIFNFTRGKRERTWLRVISLFLCVIAASVFFVYQASTTQATIPKTINFQGKLTNKTGAVGTNVADGTYSFRFKLYAASSGGSALWTETWDGSSGPCPQITVTNGVFNVPLGNCNVLSSVDFTTGALYLTIDFAPTGSGGGSSYDGEMTPRKQLLASSYSFVANSLNGDGTIGLTNTATTTNIGSITGSALTTGNALSLSNTSTVATSGNLLQGSHSATYTTALGVTGNLLNLSRALTINAAATTLTVSGAVASLSDNCTVTAGTCTNTANVLSLTQNYASASGAVLSVTGAGTGNIASLTTSNASANGALVKVQSSSSSQFALSVQSNNGSTQGLYVRADGNVGIGNASPTSMFSVGSSSQFQVNSSGAIAAVVGITNTGADNTTVSSATALTVANTGSNYALQVDTSTGTSATGLKVKSAAAAAGVALSVISSGTNENLTLDAKGSGTVSIGATSTGNIILGGSNSCIVTSSSGLLTCNTGFAAGSAGNAVTGSVALSGSTTGTVTILAKNSGSIYNFNLPTNAGNSGEVLTSAGGGATAMTWTAPGALAVRWNSIVDPSGNQTLSFGTNTSGWTTTDSTAAFLGITANSLTTGQIINIGHTTAVIADGGSLIRATSSSVDTGGATNGTLLDLSASGNVAGTLAKIVSSAASQTATTALNVTQSGATITAYTGNLISLTGGFSGASSTGSVLGVTAVNTAAGSGITVTANALTTGTAIIVPHTTSVIANGGSLLRLSSTSADTSTTTGTLLDLQSSGSTSGTIALFTNNTASFTGNTASISMTGATTGKALNVALGSTLTTGGAISVTGASYLHGTETGSVASFAFTDATTAAVSSTTNGILIVPTVNVTAGASGTKTINGVSITPTFTACTGGSTCNPNGVNIGSVTDGTGITSAAINLGTGWDTLISGTTAGANIFSFTNSSLSSAGALTVASISGGAGSFTTLTSTGASTIGTGSSLTNTFGSGASSINTIGSTTTPGALTLHGATTLDNNFSTTSSGTITSAGLLTGSLGATISGAIINLNDSSNFAVNIGTNSSTGTVTLGGTGTQTISLGNGAGVKTVNLGSSNTTSTTTILSGSGGVLLNASNNQPTNINTGSSTGTVGIGNSGAGAVSIASGAASSFNVTSNNLTLQTTTSGSLLLTSAGTSTYSLPANTATAFRFTNGTNAYEIIDTRTSNSGSSAFIWTPGSAPSIASASGAQYITSTTTPGTYNFTGSTNITATGTLANLGVFINQPTLSYNTSSGAVPTITEASTLLVNGAPKSTNAGSDTTTINSTYGINVPAVAVNGTNGIVDKGYGLSVNAPTGATINYAAIFQGGNVGIGVPTPPGVLTVVKSQYSTGTASMSGTTTITGSGTTWTSGMVGGYIHFANGTEVTIVSFTNSTTLIAQTAFTVSSQAYIIYYNIGLNVDSSGSAQIGTTTNFNSQSRLLVYGGINGANIDARGVPVSAQDISTFEAEGNDYDTTTNSIAMRYYGHSNAGLVTLMGYDSDRVGILDFTGNNAAIIRTFDNTDLHIGTNNTERMDITKAGNVGIGTTTPVAVLDVPNSINMRALPVPNAPAAGVPTNTGSCTIGSHSWKVTFVTAFGETLPSAASTVRSCTGGGTPKQTVPLTQIPIGLNGTTARKIYRTVAGNTGSYLLLTTISDNTTTTFSDTIADGSLGAAAPSSDTTAVGQIEVGGTPRITILNSGDIGIGTTSPVTGQGLTIAPAARTSGSPSLLTVTGPTDTTLAASTEAIDVNFNLARTVQFTAGSTIALQRAVAIQAPSYTFTGSNTITDTASVAISGAPVAMTNASISNTHALLISSGNVAAGGASNNSYGLTVNAQTGAASNYAAAFLGGNVGIGTATPGSLFSVGSSSQFNINSSGVITGAAGINSSGTITFSGFSNDKGLLYTDGSGILSQTSQGAANTVLHGNGSSAPSFSAIVNSDITNGTINLTTKVTGTLPVGNGGTGAATFTSNGVLYGNTTSAIQVTAAGTTGQCLVATTSAAPSWGSCGGAVRLDQLTAATATNTIANANFAQVWNWGTLTTQTGMTFGGGTAMTTGALFNLNGGTYVHTTAETGSLVPISFTDASTNISGATTTNGLNITPTINTSGAGTKTIQGINIAAPTVTACTSGACTYNGLKVTGASIANVTSTALNVDAGSGAGTNYAATFLNGNVGIGTATPGVKLQIAGSSGTDAFKITGSTSPSFTITPSSGAFQLNNTNSGTHIVLRLDNVTEFDQSVNYFLSNIGVGTVTPTSLQGGLTLGGRVAQVQNTSGVAQVDISAGGAGNVAALGFEVTDATSGKRLFQQAYDGANNLFKFRVLSESSGSVVTDNILVLKNTGNVGIGEASPGAQLQVTSATAGTIGQIIKLAASPTADAFQLQNSSGTVLTKIDANGNILPGSGPTGTALSQVLTSVDTTNDVGQYTSIKIGSDNFPIVSYYDNTNHDLRIYHCTATDCSAGAATAVDTTGDVGKFSSLAIGTDGFPVISYYDLTNGDLKVYHCTNVSCSSGGATSVDTTNDVGQYTSIAIGNDGFPIIAFYDNTNGDLRVSHCGNQACSSGNTTTTLDSTNNVGQYPNIVMDVDGFPLVAYYDVTNGDLRAAKCSTIVCTATIASSPAAIVATANDVGKYPSIVLAPAAPNNPINIFYYDTTAGDLKETTCSTLNCTAAGTPQGVESTNDVGSYLSAVVAQDGVGVVSYYDATNGDLRIAKCSTASSCISNTIFTSIDTTNNVGQYTSIVVSNDGTPVVSYYDVTNGDLRIAKCATTRCDQTSGGTSFTGGIDLGSAGTYFRNVYAYEYWGKHFVITNFDLAESYEVADSTLGAGDVVAFDANGKLVKAVSGCVPVGAISTNPAITLADPTTQGPNTQPVALAGRVPVKVTNENGAIVPGDFLTVSTTKPGYAMKAVSSGQVIGQALENFVGTAATGTITVFIKVGWQEIGDTFTLQGTQGLVIKGSGQSGYIQQWQGADGSFLAGMDSSGKMLFGSDVNLYRSEANTLKTDGNLVVAGQLNSSTLQVYNQSPNGATALTIRAGAGQAANALLQVQNSGGDNLVIVTASGNVGIGVNAPVEKLEVAGNVVAQGFITNSSADVAETYQTADGTIEAADVVSVGVDGTLVKTHSPYSAALGIVSTKPGLNLAGQESAQAGLYKVPLALVGRVPVKVSLENGVIQPGDFLTSSATLPGFAMKATKAGAVIGQALEAFPLSPRGGVITDTANAPSTGRINVFVKATSFNGVHIDQQMSDLTFDYSESSSLSAVSDSSSQILSYLLTQLPHLDNSNLSQINTDLVVAGAEVITPNVTTHSLYVDSISGATKTGGLTVEQKTLFKGGLQVNSLAAVGDSISFESDIVFIGRPYFTTDTAGFATLKQGQQSVTVTFDKEYIEQPIVNATLSLEQSADYKSMSQSDQQAAVDQQKQQLQAIFAANVQYGVLDKNTTGFTILLSAPAPQDMTFSWTALAVKSAKIFSSKDTPVPMIAGASTGGSSGGQSGGDNSPPDNGLPTPPPSPDPGGNTTPPTGN